MTKCWFLQNVAKPCQFRHIVRTRHATRQELEIRPGNEPHGEMATRIDAFLRVVP